MESYASQPGEACDVAADLYENIEAVAPCIAVIDQWSNIARSKDSLWQTFRTMYPNRPFCLLVPDPQFLSSTAPPAEYENDGLSPDGIDRTICPQGSKTAGLASDYFEICNRRRFTGDANVDFVGVFIDESGSMTRSTVKASLAKFEEDLASFGLAISSVFNGREDWITAFRNLFSAWVCSHCLAATTNGTMIGICDHCSQVCSADATCNEETDCLRDCTGIDTLQNEGAIIAQVKHVDN